MDKNRLKSQHNLPLVVILGPTASGKTSLAVEIAEKCGGEIICADSRTIYKGMDIATAKPSKHDRSRVPHWGIDLIEPGKRFTVADFKAYADERIADIRGRGKIPFLVGGSGLYIDSVIFNYNFVIQEESINRDELEKMTLDDLYDYCDKNNIKLPENYKNKRYVVRNIERRGVIGEKKLVPINNSIVVGITTEKSILFDRIKQRVDQQFVDGIIEEFNFTKLKHKVDVAQLKIDAYTAISEGTKKGNSEAEIKDRVVAIDRKLVKKQLTWFKRNKFINWLELDMARKYLLSVLVK